MRDEDTKGNCEGCMLPIKGAGFLCGSCVLVHKKHIASNNLCKVCNIVRRKVDRVRPLQ